MFWRDGKFLLQLHAPLRPGVCARQSSSVGRLGPSVFRAYSRDTYPPSVTADSGGRSRHERPRLRPRPVPRRESRVSAWEVSWLTSGSPGRRLDTAVTMFASKLSPQSSRRRVTPRGATSDQVARVGGLSSGAPAASRPLAAGSAGRPLPNFRPVRVAFRLELEAFFARTEGGSHARPGCTETLRPRRRGEAKLARTKPALMTSPKRCRMGEDPPCAL
jgi:hypothetical protein